MSIISHIVNHLNSLIQCRTISVDLISNILRKQLSTTYWSLERCSLRLVNRTYVDAVTQCWQTLTFHKLKFNIVYHTTLFIFWKGSTIIRKKNESENVTNQQHKTFKRYSAINTMTTYYVPRSRKFVQKFTFSIVNSVIKI